MRTELYRNKWSINAIPILIQIRENSFVARSEEEIQNIIQLKNILCRYLKSYFISKFLLSSKSKRFFEDFLIYFILSILDLNQFKNKFNNYSIPISSQSIINYQHKNRLILA